MKKIAIIAFLLAIIASCTKPQYIEVEKVVDRYHHTTDTVSITERVRDSVIISQKGDTVFKDRWHTEYLDRWRVRVDSFIQHDTIPEPYPVEKQLSVWQKFKVAWGETFIIAFILFLILYIKDNKKF